MINEEKISLISDLLQAKKLSSKIVSIGVKNFNGAFYWGEDLLPIESLDKYINTFESISIKLVDSVTFPQLEKFIDYIEEKYKVGCDFHANLHYKYITVNL